MGQRLTVGYSIGIAKIDDHPICHLTTADCHLATTRFARQNVVVVASTKSEMWKAVDPSEVGAEIVPRLR